jgi:predicted nucleotidyltransferase
MNSEIKILKLLLDHKEERFAIKKIAELAKINYRIAYENTLMLERDGLIKITPAGQSKLCEYTYKFDRKIFDTEDERRKELFRNKDFLVIQKGLSELTFPFIAVLFGSYAKGTANKHSDIDLLFIGGDERKIMSTIRLVPDKIHATYVTYGNFISMAKSKEFTVVSEAIKNNIILIGIEEYYRLMQNAGQRKDKEL